MPLSLCRCCALALLLAAFAGPARGQTVIYVDGQATGAGDGTSWADAYVYLQDAFDQANANPATDYEIRVAEGTYFPDEDADGGHTPGSRGESFTLTRDGITLYGGYPSGGGTRDWATHETILSGDIDGDGTLTGNSYHVVYLDGTAANGPVIGTTVLDGLTITDGNADGSGADKRGGGVYCDGSGSGSECSPQLVNLTFVGNSAGNRGGALYNNGKDGGTSSPVLTNITFSGNSAEYYGGAMYNDAYKGTSSPQLTNVTFTGNSAVYSGGAMYNNGYAGTSSPVLTNVTFSGNSAAEYYGGAMYSIGYNGTSSPQLTNVILWGNTASTSGDQIYNSYATPIISYSLIEGGCPTGSDCGDGSTILTGDPLFVDADGADETYGTADDDLRLTAFSPAVGAGDNAAVPSGVTTDLAGSPRIYGDTIDLGAYEVQSLPPTITALADQDIPEDTSTDPLAFTIDDTETAASDLTVTASSSNTAIVPDANLALAGTGADRTLTVTPAPDTSGTVDITITVSDGTYDTNETFTLTVTSVNDAPTLDVLSDLSLTEDAPEQTITLSGITSGASNEEQTLQVTAGSDNPALIPDPSVSYTSPNTGGTLIFTPVADESGTAEISVTVSDGGNTYDRHFTVTVSATNDIPTITAIADQTLREDASADTLRFTIDDRETTASALEVTAASSDTTLAPLDGLILGGTDSTRTLTLVPAPDANGQATVTLQVSDGQDTTRTSFALSISPVNDAPSFTKGPDLTVRAETTTQTIEGWATAMRAGPPDEAGQTLAFEVATGDTGLFLIPPKISPSGTLTFVPAARTSGTTNVSVRLADGGGTAGGGADTSAAQVFRITVTEANEPPAEVSGFAVQIDGRAAVLSWQTRAEKAGAYFKVQRKEQQSPRQALNAEGEAAARAWITIAVIDGLGASAEGHDYTYRTGELDYGRYTFRLKTNGWVDSVASYTQEVEAQVALAQAYLLSQVYPNPFTRRATLELTVRGAQVVHVDIYDLLGRHAREVFDGEVPANDTRRIRIERRGLANGMYFVRAVGKDFVAVRRMVVVR